MVYGCGGTTVVWVSPEACSVTIWGGARACEFRSELALYLKSNQELKSNQDQSGAVVPQGHLKSPAFQRRVSW